MTTNKQTNKRNQIHNLFDEGNKLLCVCIAGAAARTAEWSLYLATGHASTTYQFFYVLLLIIVSVICHADSFYTAISSS